MGDGVVVASGLDRALSGEMVLFANGGKGMVLNLEKSVVKVVLFGSEREVMQNDFIFRTKSIVSVVTGSYLLGCTIDSIGNSLEGPKPPYSPMDASKQRVDVKALVSSSVSPFLSHYTQG